MFPVRSMGALAAVVAICTAPALAQHHQHKGAGQRSAGCSEMTLACASTATPAFHPDGSLWVIFAAAGRVAVARSGDLGRTFATPVEVTAGPQQLDWGPDSRPKMVIDAKGRFTVAYALFKDKAFNGQVLLAQSANGQAFTPPQAITADRESQRFEALGLDPDGQVFAAWLDKRNRPAARARGQAYAGAALAYTWVSADSRHEDAAQLAIDNTCECCRLGLAFAGPGKPVIVFRNIFAGGVRDHAVLTFEGPQAPGPVQRVSDDGWKTDACPHHGPSLSISPAGAFHVAWYTNGTRRQGLFYAVSHDRGRTFSEPLSLGTLEQQASRPYVLALASAAHVVWKVFDGERTRLKVMTSTDDGRTWGPAREIAATEGDSDHPLLIAKGPSASVSWLTAKEGYRLLPLGDAM